MAGKITQNDRILQYLREHDTITPLDAQRELGCMRLASRINELRDRGYDITAKRIVASNRFGERVIVCGYSLSAEGVKRK